jgi:SpoVK/Ycf46/Vps4 family AAA+-type ATPase
LSGTAMFRYLRTTTPLARRLAPSVVVVEAALAQRPGRIDKAVEVPKPDADCRERLLRVYAAGTPLNLPSAAKVVEATDGVTASFITELVRRAVLRHVDEGGPPGRDGGSTASWTS